MKSYKYYLKSVILIFGLNSLFYFLIKLFVTNFHYMGTALDDKIPFIMGFIYIYMLWYPFEILCLYFIYKYDLKKYNHTIISIVVSLLILYMCFIIYPTKVVRPVIDSYNDLTTFVTYVTFKADSPINCFPSGHCLLCFLMIFSCFNNSKMPSKIKALIIIGNILIIFSTLYTKQHVLVDIIGSLLLAIISYKFLSNTKYLKKIKSQLPESN